MEIASINIAPMGSFPSPTGLLFKFFKEEETWRSMEKFDGPSFTQGKVEEDPATSVQPHSTSVTTTEPDPEPTSSANKEPEPPTDRETQTAADIMPKPIPTTEPVPAAKSILNAKLEVPVD